MSDIRAAVMTGPGEIGLQRFARVEPEPGAVLMRVSLSGICGTDKHTFRGETVQYAGTPHERRIRYPLIILRAVSVASLNNSALANGLSAPIAKTPARARPSRR